MPEDHPPPGPKNKRTRGKAIPEKSPSSAPVTEPVIETTGQAEKVAKELRDKLVAMLDAAALLRANRRRATAIDRVDFEAAFDDLVNPVPRPTRLALMGDGCVISEGGFVGYATNAYMGPNSGHQFGHLAIIAGAILSLVGLCLKYVDPNR